jgi:hypothetical protein
MDSKRVVFLPFDERIVNLFKGPIRNYQILDSVPESDVYSVLKEVAPLSKKERICRAIFLIPLFPVLFFILVVATFFKKYKLVSAFFRDTIDNVFGSLFKRDPPKETYVLKDGYRDVETENVLEFLQHCKKCNTVVALYSIHSLSAENEKKVNKLIKQGYVSYFLPVNSLYDLSKFVQSEHVSIKNSFLVISELREVWQAGEIGFNVDIENDSNVALWHRGKLPAEYGSLVTHSAIPTLVSLDKRIRYYLKGDNALFLTSRHILFIEDTYDKKLNDYIKSNLQAINARLKGKGFQLLYIPALKEYDNDVIGGMIRFLRYKHPVLYAMPENEIVDLIHIVIDSLSPIEFYKSILEELDLPYFKRPALFRLFTAGKGDVYHFTYAPIEYDSEESLDRFFDWYIGQVARWSWMSEQIYFHLEDGEEDEELTYDADLFFKKEVIADSAEIEKVINDLQSEGKYTALGYALIQILKKLKVEKPEFLPTIKNLVNHKKLLVPETTLSPIVLNKQYKIILPEFGNVEVKMHALPKAVYILFLKHPEGIRFKELPKYKKELLDIYSILTNKYDPEEIERAVNDLVNLKNPSINQKCSRIREAFRAIMDENIACQYYINGAKGEPKKIALSASLIKLEC